MQGKMPFPIPFVVGALIAAAGAMIMPLLLQKEEPEVAPEGANDATEVITLHRVPADKVLVYLREVGVIDDESKIISTEWLAAEKKWLVITEQGKHDDGEPRFGHWFVEANAKDWSGSFCRH